MVKLFLVHNYPLAVKVFEDYEEAVSCSLNLQSYSCIEEQWFIKKEGKWFRVSLDEFDLIEDDILKYLGKIK